MLIEHIVEFELRGPGPLVVRTCNPKTGYFHDKTKISQGKSGSELLPIFTGTAKNIGEGNVGLLCFPPTWLSHLQNVTPKRKVLNVFLDLKCKGRKD